MIWSIILSKLIAKLGFFDTGERDAFYLPHYKLRNKLQQMQIKIDDKKFNSSFKTSKKLLSNAITAYINGLQEGIQQFSH